MRNSAFALSLCAACHNEPAPSEVTTCTSEEIPSSIECDAALKFAARDSLAIRPSQTDIDIYYDRWMRAVAAEPVLAARSPQSYRNRQWSGINVYTESTTIVSAWSMGHLATSVPAIDATVEALFEPRIGYHDQIGETMTHVFTIYVGGIYSEDLVHRGMVAGGARLDESLRHSGDDGVWAWTGEGRSIAQIDFTFGWGDCFVACTGYRTLVAVVGATGAAEVYDAGGDPLPDNIQLSPTTRPLNEK